MPGQRQTAREPPSALFFAVGEAEGLLSNAIDWLAVFRGSQAEREKADWQPRTRYSQNADDRGARSSDNCLGKGLVGAETC